MPEIEHMEAYMLTDKNKWKIPNLKHIARGLHRKPICQKGTPLRHNTQRQQVT